MAQTGFKVIFTFRICLPKKRMNWNNLLKWGILLFVKVENYADDNSCCVCLCIRFKKCKIPIRLNCWSNCKYDRSIDRSIHKLNKWRKANAVLFVALVISKNCFFPPQANFLNENPPNFVYNECMLVKKMYFFITEKHNFVPLNNPFPPTQNVHKIWRKKIYLTTHQQSKLIRRENFEKSPFDTFTSFKGYLFHLPLLSSFNISNAQITINISLKNLCLAEVQCPPYKPHHLISVSLLNTKTIWHFATFQ